MKKTWGVVVLLVLLAAPSIGLAQSLDLTFPDGCIEPSVIAPVAAVSKDTRTHAIIRAVVMVIGVGMDIHSTDMAMHTPGLVESNSRIYGRHPSLRRLVITKAVINLPLLWLSKKVAEKEGPIDALMPVAISSVRQGLAGGMNYALIKKQRKANAGGGQ
jgi:hypothetical protein